MASSLVPPTNRRRQDSQPCAFVNDPLVLGYYQSFHPAHPILLSLPSLRGSLARTVPGHVVAAVRYIGARYMQKKDVESTLYKEAARVLCSPQADGYHVQSRLLLAIAAHGNGEHEQAQQILDHTITMALNLGMHTAKFATEHANGSPALEDMWRRTFWELFAVDTLFGVLHERVPRLQEVLTDVPLPGDEAMYLDHEMTVATSYAPPDPWNENWAARSFDRVSSYARRIEALMLLARITARSRAIQPAQQSTTTVPDAVVNSLDEGLTRCRDGVPSLDDAFFKNQGTFDEMAYQTLIIIYSATIYLFRPYSPLSLIPVTPPLPYPYPYFNSSFRKNASINMTNLSPTTRKLILAADSLCDLLSLPIPARRHSPFLIHAVSLGVLVHTAACVARYREEWHTQESLQVRIECGVGVLRKMAEIWPLADRTKAIMVDVWRGVRDSC